MENNIKKTMGTVSAALIITWLCIGCIHTSSQHKRVSLKDPEFTAEPEPSSLPQAEPVVPVEILPITFPDKTTSNKPKAVEKSSHPEPDYYVHRVRWYGENLSIVAKWYTGKFGNWKAIADANPHINPNRILLGNRIRIPQKLLNTADPMPEDFVSKFTTKVKKKESHADTPKHPVKSVDEEKTELFGLREYRDE